MLNCISEMNLKYTYSNSLTTAISSSMSKEYPKTQARRLQDIREFLYKFMDFQSLEFLFSISTTFKGIQVLYEPCINSSILLPFSNFVNNFVISSSKLDQISAKKNIITVFYETSKKWVTCAPVNVLPQLFLIVPLFQIS